MTGTNIFEYTPIFLPDSNVKAWTRKLFVYEVINICSRLNWTLQRDGSQWLLAFFRVSLNWHLNFWLEAIWCLFITRLYQDWRCNLKCSNVVPSLYLVINVRFQNLSRNRNLPALFWRNERKVLFLLFIIRPLISQWVSWGKLTDVP